MTMHDNTNEPTIKRDSHAWAVLEGDTPLFHTPGTYPPKWEVDPRLESLWRKGQKKREMRQLDFFDNYVLSR